MGRMKKSFLTSSVLAIAGVGLLAGSAMADPIVFQINESLSSVSFANGEQSISGWPYGSTLEVAFAGGFEGFSFELDEIGESASFDFLTFTATGSGIGFFDIDATMAFYSPVIDPVMGSGSGWWFNLGGSFVAGALSWEENIIDITDSLGNIFTLTLAQGLTVVTGAVETLTATITLQNFGSGTVVVGDGQTPVPEPATMLLFGAGLVGLAGFTRMKKAVLKK